MRTPRHMSNKQFALFILDCAIRDRRTFLESMIPEYGQPDETTQHWIAETKAELEAMRHRRKIVLRQKA